MSVDNLKIVYEKATPEDTRLALDSYFKYNRLVRQVAGRHGFSARVGAAVFAALSPNNDYYGNLRDTDRLLSAAARDESMNSFKVSTYGQNKFKAWCIAHGLDPLDLITAKKTRNFFLSIDDPTHPTAVCVDGHMYNCWRNERKNLVGIRKSDREYEEVAAGIRELASRAGVIPSQMQGILWITHRRIHGIRSPAQTELWEPESRAAGLGWVPSFRAASGQLKLIDG